MNDRVSARDAAEPNPAAQFRLLWEQGDRPDVGAFLAATNSLPANRIAAVLRVDQRFRWRLGDRVQVEAYFSQFSVLGTNPESAVDLIYGEYLLREELGERPDVNEYASRFPAYATDLREQIGLHQAMLAGQTAATNPIDSVQTSPEGVPPAQVEFAGPISETHTLVWRQLRRAILVFLGLGFVGTIARLWWFFHSQQFGIDPGLRWFQLVSGVVGYSILIAIGRYVLRGRPSLVGLRRAELILVALATMNLASNQYVLNVTGEFARFVKLGGDAVSYRALALAAQWGALILIYGTYIPNTARRCAAVTGAIAVVALACTIAGVARSSYDSSAVNSAIVATAGALVLAVLVSVYGAHKIAVHRKEAYEARRLGPYKLSRKLGAGGMGEVYLAEHNLLKRPCAVKLIRPDQAGNPSVLRRFEREVRSTAALTHPNTVQVFDYGHTPDGTFYYAMEYLPGTTLQDLVDQTGPLPTARAIHVLCQLCGALREAHAAGLIHRDIKPSNVILGDRGGRVDVAKLLDFGLVTAPSVIGDDKITQDGSIAGTPAYMSPEQAAGKPDIGPASDIYSLGALAYFLLTGRSPFCDRSAVAALAAHLYETPAPLTTHRPDLPSDLEGVILQCLAKQPAARFPNMQELETALVRCAATCSQAST